MEGFGEVGLFLPIFAVPFAERSVGPAVKLGQPSLRRFIATAGGIHPTTVVAEARFAGERWQCINAFQLLIGFTSLTLSVAHVSGWCLRGLTADLRLPRTLNPEP